MPALGDGGHSGRKAAPPTEGIVCPVGYQPDCALKLSACHDVVKALGQILPPDDCQAAVLWHKDLDLNNIFVGPERHYGHYGLIVWQNANVAPL